MNMKNNVSFMSCHLTLLFFATPSPLCPIYRADISAAFFFLEYCCALIPLSDLLTQMQYELALANILGVCVCLFEIKHSPHGQLYHGFIIICTRPATTDGIDQTGFFMPKTVKRRLIVSHKLCWRF